jgi:hypothetical protein
VVATTQWHDSHPPRTRCNPRKALKAFRAQEERTPAGTPSDLVRIR